MTGPDTDTTTERQQKLAAAWMALAHQSQEQAATLIASAEKAVDVARHDLRRSQRWGTGLALALFVILSAGAVIGGVGAWLISGQRVELVNIADDLAAAVGERDRFAEIAEITADDLEHAQRELTASAAAWLLLGDQLSAAAARAQGEQWGAQSVLASPGP